MQDLVSVHRALCRHLGVERLRCVIGGSLGGMQALQWVLDAPDELDSAVLACSTLPPLGPEHRVLGGRAPVDPA